MAVLPTGIGPVTGYNIERSLRFNSADSANLTRTFGSAPTNDDKATISLWVKRTNPGAENQLYSARASGANAYTSLRFDSTDELDFLMVNSSSTVIARLVTTAKYRDPSAWYHIVFAYDSTDATSSNRLKLYVNGVQVTVFNTATYPAQNTDLALWAKNTVVNYIGREGDGYSNYLNGYLTEVNFVDGQALTPSSFGQTNASTGVWEPIPYTGTYGTNGFYVNFSDNSGTTSTTLGKDSSGNGNNWTPNNFSVTAGAGNDSLVDSPTSYGTDTGVGGEVRGNYCTLNPLKAALTLSNGSLDGSIAASASANQQVVGTFGVSSGKWYFEVRLNTVGGSGTGTTTIGVTKLDSVPTTNNISNGQAWSYYGFNGQKYNTTGTAYGNTYAAGNTVGVALDMDNGKIWFSKDGVFQASGDPVAGTNAAFTNLTGQTVMPWVQDDNANSPKTFTANFGQRAFAYTAPSGFKALCTQNLPTPTIGATSTTQANKYMDVTLYTGNQTVRSITNSGSMQPDFVWDKLRDGSNSHRLFDAVRGVEKALYSNLTNAEATETGTLTSFNSNGFSLGTSTETNTTGSTYVAWQWNAGGSNQTISVGQYATSPANVPSIASTVRANTTSGFSIVTATLGAAGVQDTVGHGLGAVPSMILFKTRSGANYNWSVFHVSISTDTTKYLRLNGTSATLTYSTVWGAALPTSTVFGVTGDGVGSPSNPFVAYCFAPVAGYSAFGSYTGNGAADGPFVYTGFRPRFLMIKSTSAGEWVMMDSTRNTYNLADTSLYANRTYSEATIGTVDDIDFLSNGFKLRNNTGFVNSSQTYIYAAFAESPFKYSLAR